MIIKLFFIFLTFAFLTLPSETSAHFVKSSGSVGALLHMDPEDDPIAGASGNIILEFKDTEGKFTLTNCDCKLFISEDGKEVRSLTLNPVSDIEQLSSVTPFTFPEKNIYKLKITGIPKSGAEFNNFELNYDVRVSRELASGNIREEKSSWVSEHVVHLAGAGVVVVFFIVALIIQSKKKIVAMIFILILLSHILPIKAIHASHDGHFNEQSYACCLPVNAITPSAPELSEPVSIIETDKVLTILIINLIPKSSFFTRPPPLS